jgi:hypothetical protein
MIIPAQLNAIKFRICLHLPRISSRCDQNIFTSRPMCKRVSTTHSVKGDFTFLWEHAIFRYLPNENPLTDRSEILHLDCVGETTKCAKNGYNRLAYHISEILACKHYFTSELSTGRVDPQIGSGRDF